MILLASIPNLDSSPSALTDTSRRASDRDRRSRNQAPTPPGNAACAALDCWSSATWHSWKGISAADR